MELRNQAAENQGQREDAPGCLRSPGFWGVEERGVGLGCLENSSTLKI